ncbi:thaumatin [Mycena vulgaris]|nr:thaumatin [Mycena vulgaris]
MKFFIALSLATSSTVVAQRTMTVSDRCSSRPWPPTHATLFTSAGGRPAQATGWVAGPFTPVTFSVPSDWNGRIWGRRDCQFSAGGGGGPNSCLDGGCNGGLLCDPVTGTGVPPATLAEFNLGNYLFMVLGLRHGFRMRIDNNAGCGIPSCPVDLGPNCPALLKGPFDPSGFPVGCQSACVVDALNGRAADSPNCCSGSHDTPATCPSSGVTDYDYFKGNCPNAYAYAYDDATALFTCPSSRNAVYTVTFCP